MKMQNNSLQFLIPFTNLLLILCLSGHVQGYNNYTVGDSIGWYDILESPNVDYQRWAADKNFSLGDFLIFNTDNNHSVVQTYNFTTYELCDFEDALDNDTIQWSSENPSSTNPDSVTVPVPLIKVGMNYFFSSAYDGEQCRNGQHFMINVTYGQGLPPALSDEDADSLAPISPESGDDEPEILVPPNIFDNPKDNNTDNGNAKSKSISVFAFSNLFRVQLLGLMMFLGVFLFHGY